MHDVLAFAIAECGLRDETPRTVYKVHCPFHDDHRPSLSLTQDGRYKCYACGASGASLYRFLMERDGLSAWDAMYAVSKYTDTRPLPSLQWIEKEPPDVSANVQLVQRIWNGEMPYQGMRHDWTRPDGEAMGYLMGRGFLARTLQHFHVVVWTVLRQYPIMLPLVFNNQVYGYQLRGCHSWVTPKYFTMPGLTKHAHVYGQARPGKPVVLTEGVLDMYMSVQYGCEDSICLLGSHLSIMQRDVIAALQPPYILAAFDRDAAGLRVQEQCRAMLAPIPVYPVAFTANDVARCRRDDYTHAIAAAKRDAE